MTVLAVNNTTSVEEMQAKIEAILVDPSAKDNVIEYLSNKDNLAGTTFNTLGPNDPNSINADDLIAVHLLGGRAMSFSPPTVRALLCDKDIRKAINELLLKLPLNVSLWEPEAESLIKTDGPASELWHLLHMDNLGDVKAGKILARKRPRLIPIFDDLVQQYFKPPAGKFWETLRAALQKDNLPNQIDKILRPTFLKEKEKKEKITTLRLLDIAVWMKMRNKE